MSNIDFDILIDERISNLNINCDSTSIDNKNILSLINDFEDGKWRYEKFQDFILDNIVETALSKEEKEKLVNKSHTSLRAAAKKLRFTDKESDIGKGGELAEIVLYGIMKHHYSALTIVPKIFYKQSAQDYAKGADSVHIIIEDDGADFSLWFGEAKFYDNIENSRFDKIIDSIKNSLQTDKLKKENSIITSLSDIDKVIPNLCLIQRIKDFLSNKNSIDNIKSKIHIPILLLHQCNITNQTTELTDKYKKEIKIYHKERANSYFIKQINKIEKDIFYYSKIKFHLILFPVPKKNKITEKFIKNVEYYRTND